MNESELVKTVKSTEIREDWRRTIYGDESFIVEYLAKTNIEYVDEEKIYESPITKNRFLMARVNSILQSGKTKDHNAFILEDAYRNPSFNDLLDSEGHVIAAIVARGNYKQSSFIELPWEENDLNIRNETGFTFLNRKVFLIKKEFRTNRTARTMSMVEFKLMGVQEYIEESIQESIEFIEPHNPNKGTIMEKAFMIDWIVSHCEKLKEELIEKNGDDKEYTEKLEEIISNVSLKMRMKFSY